MSALGRKVMDLAEQQGLLDGKAIAELRKKVAESKFIVTPEAIAKVLVDHGHLTPFQARRLVSQAVGPEPEPQAPAPVQRPVKKDPVEDLTFADEAATPDAGTIDLEPDEPQPSAPKKGAPSPPMTQRPGQNRPKRELPVTAPMPLEGSTEDELDLVESAEPQRSAPRPSSSSRWKTDPSSSEDEVDLAPLDPTAPTLPPLDNDLMPLEDLLTPIDPAARVAAGPARLPPPAHRGGAVPVQLAPAKNVWDSPLLLVGGGILGITLIAF